MQSRLLQTIERPGRDETPRLERRLERERCARREAERISETVTRDLFERQQEIALLGEIATAANHASDLGEVIQLTLGKVCAHLNLPLGHAYLREGEEMVPTDIWYVEDVAQTAAFRRGSETRRFGAGEGLPGRVLVDAEPASIPDILVDDNFPRAAEARESGIRGALAFPIVVGPRAEGVLEFFSYQPSEADAGILELMRQVGTQLGRLVERIRAQERIVHQATHDPLTGLPNRVVFKDRINEALKQCLHTKRSLALCFIDLDRFKFLNDNFGHGAGDELLRVVADRLLSEVRPTDTVARMGGDEFVVLLRDLVDETEAVRLVENLAQSFHRPFTFRGNHYTVGASIGVALGPGSGDGETLMRDADAAMYRAKERGRGRYELCDEAVRERARVRAETERDLNRALEREEFELHFQPIVRLGSGEVCAVEALLRWRHPERGLVSAADFIPIAEESGQIVRMGSWVLREACRQAAQWRAELGAAAPMPVTVNLSPRQLASGELIEEVEEVLALTGCRPQDLALELTEGAAVANGESAFEILQGLRTLGVKVLLDDFGTGYSSLNHIRRLPIDTIKIDGSFVRDLGTRQEASAIVGAIVGMATALGLEVIAEGAETAEQAALASELGCGFGQGFHFARPMPPSELRVGDRAGFATT